MDTGAVSELATRFSGQILRPTDTGYDEARSVHNGLIDKRPALVACCRPSPMSLMRSTRHGSTPSPSPSKAAGIMSPAGPLSRAAS